MKRHSKRLLAAAIVIAAGLVVAGWTVSRSRPGPDIIVARAPNRFAPRRASLWRYVPISWGWVWRLRQAVVGQPRRVNLQPAIVAFPALPNLVSSNLQLGVPDFADTNGLQVWRLSEQQLNRLRQLAEKLPDAQVLSTARIATADKVQASLFCGHSVVVDGVTNNVGAVVDCFPRVHPDATELTAAVTWTDEVTNQAPNQSREQPGRLVVQTNLDIAAKARLAPGQGLFLLDGGSAGRRLGVIIPVQVPIKK